VSAAIVGLGFFAVLVGVPVLTGHPALTGRGGGVSPRVAAGAHLVSLVGWALLPAVWLACSGSALGSWLSGIRPAGGGCLFGLDQGQWTLLGYLPGTAVLGVLVWHGLRRAAAARRAEMPTEALAGSVCRPTRAGEVWVIPSARPVACAAGLWRCRAVVSSGLLAALGAREREAVCEHEVAHVRLGHPRLLVFGGAVAGAYGGFAPVRRAWDGLRRELEAAADDEAVGVVGREAVLSALLQVALMARRAPDGVTPGFGGAEHLRWRVARLEHPGTVGPWPTALVGTAAAVTGSAMAFVGCLLAGAPATLLGVLSCLGVVAAVGLRPLGGWGRRAPARRVPRAAD
jgi:hypothetical protein